MLGGDLIIEGARREVGELVVVARVADGGGEFGRAFKLILEDVVQQRVQRGRLSRGRTRCKQGKTR